jgi:outer membrane immunogenic protein
MKTSRLTGCVTVATLILAGTLNAFCQQASGDDKQSAAASTTLLAYAPSGPSMAGANASSAAAVPNVPAPPSGSGYSWMGFYVGGHAGYGVGNANTSVVPLPSAAQFFNLAPTQLHPAPTGGLGGGQAGYNLQHGYFVAGAEMDFSWSGMTGTQTVSPIIQINGVPFPGPPRPNSGFLTAHQETNWIGTLRGRIGGAVFPRVLVYGTGGLAYGSVTSSANTDFRPAGTEQYPASLSKNKTGWVAGAGAEFSVTPRWSVKGEYLYYDLGSDTITANPTVPFPPPPFPQFQIAYAWQTSAHTFRGGVNFHF